VDDAALRLPVDQPVPRAHAWMDKPQAFLHESEGSLSWAWCDIPDSADAGMLDGALEPDPRPSQWIWVRALHIQAPAVLAELGTAAAAVSDTDGRVLGVSGTARAVCWLSDHGLQPGLPLPCDTGRAPNLGRAMRAALDFCQRLRERRESADGVAQTAWLPVCQADEAPWVASATPLVAETDQPPPGILCLWSVSSEAGLLRATLRALAESISQWVRADQQQRELQRVDGQIRDIDRYSMLTSLAAGIAHEIRNPLTTARGFLQLFAERLVSDADKQFLELTIEELDRIHRLVADFMSLAKPVECAYQHVNATSVMRSTAEFIKPEALLRGVILDTEIPDVDVWVWGDEKQLKQVMLNIAQNAMQACCDGGRVTLDLHACPEHVLLRVRDTGCGIPPQDLDKVFQPFYTTKPAGTGLGLAISKRIVEEHRGSIEIDSTVGVGTTVTIRLPRVFPPGEANR
jgi:signal transduction histidine kinase